MADERESKAKLIAGVALAVKFPEDEDYEIIGEVTSFPSIGGVGQRVKVTTILDTSEVYIAGLPDQEQGSIPVNFVDTNPQHQKLFDAQYKIPKDTIMLRCTLPSGVGFTWPAEISGVLLNTGEAGTTLGATISYEKKGKPVPTWADDTPTP